MNNEENNKNEATESSKPKRKRITKKPQPIAAVKPSIADKIKQLDKQGFDHNRIAAMLMCQKSLVKDTLK